jgi:hypothetical protein
MNAARRARVNGAKPFVLYHATDWTIVTDPPGEMRTLMTFPDEQSARESLAAWKAKGDQHSYILAPGPGGRS